ncbi:serine/arginine repetitive matrix protein 1-like [Antechinus flavipes]|uniref:serine/arginine repetitive matrix protein 1-like n=1 Tax=Antechinus flavipes TaxID=38775 RepID=UPI002235CB41|nr:serine/arginine repetitive matrix protein 1-like [Antechinus flavipes]
MLSEQLGQSGWQAKVQDPRPHSPHTTFFPPAARTPNSTSVSPSVDWGCGHTLLPRPGCEYAPPLSLGSGSSCPGTGGCSGAQGGPRLRLRLRRFRCFLSSPDPSLRLCSPEASSPAAQGPTPLRPRLRSRLSPRPGGCGCCSLADRASPAPGLRPRLRRGASSSASAAAATVSRARRRRRLLLLSRLAEADSGQGPADKAEARVHRRRPDAHSRSASSLPPSSPSPGRAGPEPRDRNRGMTRPAPKQPPLPPPRRAPRLRPPLPLPRATPRASLAPGRARLVLLTR